MVIREAMNGKKKKQNSTTLAASLVFGFFSIEIVDSFRYC